MEEKNFINSSLLNVSLADYTTGKEALSFFSLNRNFFHF